MGPETCFNKRYVMISFHSLAGIVHMTIAVIRIFLNLFETHYLLQFVKYQIITKFDHIELPIM